MDDPRRNLWQIPLDDLDELGVTDPNSILARSVFINFAVALLDS